MTLYINTSDPEIVIIAIKEKSRLIVQKKFKARFRQAERLLPEIDKMLKSKKIKLTNLKEIEVNDEGGSFTSLRIGVVTANTLSYALNIPVKATSGAKNLISGKIKIVEPKYDREAIIG
jgi:tRNA A37 threonylcarbamoyladenosine modification protein TsaB